MPDLDSIAALHSRLKTVEITGTNGKSTTTSMIAAIVAASGEVDARFITIGAWVNGEEVPIDRSMGAFLEVMRVAATLGGRTVSVEVTSAALERGFAAQWPPHVGVFTNLTRDHLDEHHTPEEYLAAKAQLFMNLLPGGVAVLNAEDPCSELISEVLPEGIRVCSFAIGEAHGATLTATRVEVSRAGLDITLAPGSLADRLGNHLHVPTHARFNAWNALAAALAADALGYAPEAIALGLSRYVGVAGRFQVIADEPLTVVDFAHTPDAFVQLLRSARLLTGVGGEVICVFGCAGHRDPDKRPEIGRVVDALADRALITTNSSRGEDPAAICDMVMEGIEGSARWTRELDRGHAIELALRDARPCDVVVIAGKGPDETEYDGETPVRFSDIEHARRVCLELGGDRPRLMT